MSDDRTAEGLFGLFWIMSRITPSRWAAVSSVVSKIGCSAHTLNEWVKRTEVESGSRADIPLKKLKAQDRELRQANEILRKAAAKARRR